MNRRAHFPRPGPPLATAATAPNGLPLSRLSNTRPNYAGPMRKKHIALMATDAVLHTEEQTWFAWIPTTLKRNDATASGLKVAVLTVKDVGSGMRKPTGRALPVC